MKKYGKIILIVLLAVMSAVSLWAVQQIRSRINTITEDVEQMYANAVALKAQGKQAQAIQQLRIFCQEEEDNVEGFLLLGDWYTESGNEADALRAYQQAASNLPLEENQLGEQRKSLTVTDDISDLRITISPAARYSRDMTLTITGQNVTPTVFQFGRINGDAPELAEAPECVTTDWFQVDATQGSLVLSGRMNCAVWQFMDAEGYISYYIDPASYRDTTIIRFTSGSYATVQMPPDAVKARVTFWKSDEAWGPDGEILITYGTTLTGYSDQETQTYQIPDLQEHESIVYADGVWSLFDGETYTNLDWKAPKISRGSHLSVDGTLCGVVKLSGEAAARQTGDKRLRYGVRFSNESGISVCQRLGDAVGMNFNYTVGNAWVYSYENDFDTAYPWCEMKLCNVTVDPEGRTTVTYENEPGFSMDGSNGNVMVQIPKFYTRRTVQDGCEEIWISGTRYDGYVLEPVFESAEGELDYVYIGAYLGAELDEKIVSRSGVYPTINLTYGDTLVMAESNGAGFSEMNYWMLSALQRLFVVETGTLDSSSLFAGETTMLYYTDTPEDEKSARAAFDAENTNTITLYDNFNTRKIVVGSSIVLTEDWRAYRNGSEACREVLSITEVGDYLELTFDGDPIDVIRHETLVSNIPARTGKTDAMDYCTGTLEGTEGTVSFRYRNIENLYGSALVMLDRDAYVEKGYFCFTDEAGNTVCVSEMLADQPLDLSSYSHITSTCIRKMTWDEQNPLVMLPAEVGDGSDVYTYYGDYWMYKFSEDPRYLAFGGADDNSRVAGMFQLRAIISGKNYYLTFLSARIMYR